MQASNQEPWHFENACPLEMGSELTFDLGRRDLIEFVSGEGPRQGRDDPDPGRGHQH